MVRKLFCQQSFYRSETFRAPRDSDWSAGSAFLEIAKPTDNAFIAEFDARFVRIVRSAERSGDGPRVFMYRCSLNCS